MYCILMAHFTNGWPSTITNTAILALKKYIVVAVAVVVVTVIIETHFKLAKTDKMQHMWDDRDLFVGKIIH